MLETPAGEIRQLKPRIYQEVNGIKVPVPARYVLESAVDGQQSSVIGQSVSKSAGQQVSMWHSEFRIPYSKQSRHLTPDTRHPAPGTRHPLVTFQIDAYDTTRPLVIDPQIVFTTEIRASGAMSPSAFHVDAAGNIYVGGATSAPDLPGRTSLQTGLAGGEDAYLVKLNPQGTILFSVYLGGSGTDRTNGLAADASGNIYFAGQTASANFPTRSPLQSYGGGAFRGDGFVAKLSPDGSALVYSTLLGGSDDDFATGLTIDSGGNAYVTGETNSTNFPVRGGFQARYGGSIDVFVSKLNPAGSALVYSSYLGGARGTDGGPRIAVDGSGNAYVTGRTISSDFPTVTPFQAALRGQDAFVTKVNAAGSTLVYSTFLGGDEADTPSGIAVDASGNAYIAGSTASRNFPTRNPFQAALSGTQDAFVTKLAADGRSLVYSSYLGGTGSDTGRGMAIDPAGRAYVVGTPSAGFPTKDPIQTSGPGFLTQVAATGSEIEFSSYIGDANTLFATAVGVDPRSVTKTGIQGAQQANGSPDYRVNVLLLLRTNSIPLLWQLLFGPLIPQADIAVASVGVEVEDRHDFDFDAVVRVRIKNLGPNEANGVTLSFFPDALTFHSAVNDCDPCQIGTLAKDGIAVRQIVRGFASPSVTLEIVAASSSPLDPDTSNNSYLVRFLSGELVVHGDDGVKRTTLHQELFAGGSGFGSISLVSPPPKSNAHLAVLPTQPTVLAIFGFVQNNVLITEAGIPAAARLTRARMFVDLSGGANNGVAIVNPGTSPMTVAAEARNASGLSVSTASFSIPAQGKFAKFPTELGLNLPVDFLGTVTLSSTGPFAAVNLRTAVNGRGEPLFSALPLADLDNPAKGSTAILSQIADGGGLPTQILLMNISSTETATGNVSLFDDGGNPLAADFGASIGVQSRLSYSIPANGMVKFSTTGAGPIRAGYAVASSQSGPLPVASVIFSLNGSAGLASQAGVLASPQTTSARFFAEVASAPRSRNTGIALVNRNSATATVNLKLTDNLSDKVRTATLTLNANNHVAKFINELFTDLPADFSGILTLTSNVPVAPVTLRLTINERGDPILSALPVADLNNPPAAGQILAHIASGCGFSTELILLNTSSQIVTIQIDFFDDNGVKVTSPFP